MEKNDTAFAVWCLLDYMYKHDGECSISEAVACIGSYYERPLELVDILVRRGIITNTQNGSVLFFNKSVNTLIQRAKAKHPELFEKFIIYQPTARMSDF